MAGPDLPLLAFPDPAAFRAWLEATGEASPGFWMTFAKAGAPEPTLAKAQAIETALCFGWIDGQIATLEEAYFRTRFTPRRPHSKWSAINCQTAERLIAQGAMAPAGLREVEAAKADGRWEAAYAGSAGSEVPPDLVEALASEPKARAMFESLSRQNRYAVLYRIATAKRADTRARRIEQFVAMLARGETIHPQKRAPGL